MMQRISRRAVLRGAGVTMALPWLESLPAFADPAGSAGAPYPKRFGVLFMGNGVNGTHWWAKGRGAEMQLGPSLRPLAPIKHKLIVINGLFNERAVGRGIHPAQTGNLLSGAPLRRGAVPTAGVTVDQVIAEQMGRTGPRQSLVLSCEAPITGVDESRFSMAYSSHVSWRSDRMPAAMDVSPSRAFDRLFQNDSRVYRASVLDRVRDRAARLRRRVGSHDAHRLDAYFTRVRDVERRTLAARARFQPDDSGDIRERSRLMCDLIALAFQTDSTRVASLVLARDLSSLRYPFLGAAADHHAMSHDDLSDGYERIVRFHVGRLAYLAQTLDAMPEGEGTVLDNCCLLWLSNMWSGWKHDNMKLPVVLAGGLGGTLHTGRALDYLYEGSENRRLCSLYLAIMERMGLRVEAFGDATRPLTL
jgi:hypothetical protein